MKLFFIILFFSLNASATNYYVSNTGSDAANGLTAGTAWATIAKVNAGTFVGGDSILFKRGDTWNDRLNVSWSGSSGSFIYIGAYGTGAKPMFTGFQTATGWTNVGNIWSATLTNSVPSQNTILVNGVFAAKGRYPNTGYLTFTGYVGKGQVRGTGLTGTPNYTGAEAVVRSSHYTIDRVQILSHSVDTLRFRDSLYYTPNIGGNGVFIQNIESVLDLQNEWCYDSASRVLKVYSTTEPVVQYSTVDTCIRINNKAYITVDNIAFSGINQSTIQIDSSNRINVTNCAIYNTGGFGIYAQKSKYIIADSDSIIFAHNAGMYFANPFGITADNCDSSTVNNNYIKKCGTIPGMGAKPRGDKSVGIYLIGKKTVCTNNYIDSVGYVGLNWAGNQLVKNNHIKNYCMTKFDGGGMYTCVYSGAGIPFDYNQGAIVRGNIIENGITDLGGTAHPWVAAGIYLDCQTNGVTVDSNTIINSFIWAFMFSGAQDITLRNNTIISSRSGGIYYSPAGGNNFRVQRNIIYGSDTTNYLVNVAYNDHTGPIDTNYYLRPKKDTLQFFYNVARGFSNWKANTVYDDNSQITPTGITTDDPFIFINPTLSDTVIALPGEYKDPTGATYTNTVTVAPFRSIILFKTTSDIFLPSRLRGLRFNRVRQ